MTIIKRSLIVKTEEVCTYCGDTWRGSHRGCCGEVHTSLGHELKDHSFYLDEEVNIIEDEIKGGG